LIFSRSAVTIGTVRNCPGNFYQMEEKQNG
jgi:hypothetical protein